MLTKYNDGDAILQRLRRIHSICSLIIDKLWDATQKV